MSELLARECRAGDGGETPPRPRRARYAARLTFEFSLRSAGLAGRPSPSSTTTLSRMVGSSWTLPMLSVLNNLSSSMRSRCPFASMGTEFWKLVEVAASRGLACASERGARRTPGVSDFGPTKNSAFFRGKFSQKPLQGNRSKFRVRVGERGAGALKRLKRTKPATAPPPRGPLPRENQTCPGCSSSSCWRACARPDAQTVHSTSRRTRVRGHSSLPPSCPPADAPATAPQASTTSGRSS